MERREMVHIDLAREILDGQDNYGGEIKFDEANLSEPQVIEFPGHGHTLVTHVYDGGPREVDQIAIVGFYTNDGNVTVAVNHIDGLHILDDASLMFPAKEADNG